jgi:hypothetical protein
MTSVDAALREPPGGPAPALREAVAFNCRLSDARHARELTLCTYLLEMRELFRWEHGIRPGVALPRDAVGAWIAEREAQWGALEGREYRPLPLAAGEVDPFDVEAANAELLGQGLVYGAGVGRHGKPQFFLAALACEEWRGDLRILVAGAEYARDIAPAPAALRAKTAYVRQDALERWIAGRAESWAPRRADGAMKAALDAYRCGDGDPDAFARMARAETEAAILHEMGEHAAGARLGPAWSTALAAIARTPAELYARAARDHLADCLVTLPMLMARGATASLHFWFANLDGMRREAFPRIAGSYAAFRDGDMRPLEDAVAFGAAHFDAVCRRIAEAGELGTERAVRAVDALRAAAVR